MSKEPENIDVKDQQSLIDDGGAAPEDTDGIQLESTTNYELFYSPSWQRGKDPNRIHKMSNTLEDFNASAFWPVVVKFRPREKGRFMILDGQHRFEAIKNKGQKLHYIVDYDDKLSPKDIGIANAHQEDWNRRDWINYYCDFNFDEYIFLRDMIDKHGLTPYSAAKTGLKFEGYGFDNFEDGKFEIKNKLEFKEYCAHLGELEDAGLKYAKKTVFMRVYVKAYRHPSFDRDRFIDRIKATKNDKIEDINDRSHLMRQICDVYNYNKQQKFRLYASDIHRHYGNYDE